MAEEAEVVERTEEQGAASLAEGFAGENIPTQPVVAAAPEEVVVEQPVEIEIVQVTRKDFDRLMAAADKADTVEGQFAKVFGTIGNVKNELLNRLQTMTPAGDPVEVTVEDFAEMNTDFEELTKQQVAGLNRVLKKLNVRGTGQPAIPAMDAEQVRVAAATVVQSEGLRDLDDLHPGWRDIVGMPDDADNAYRKWLKTQPPEYQQLVRTTYSASITSRSIDRFKAAQVKKPVPPVPTPKPTLTAAQLGATRRAVVAAAVQPRGNGATPPAPRPPTPEENMTAGFNS